MPALHARDSHIVAANAAYETFMHVRAAEIVGRRFDEVVEAVLAPHDTALVQSAVERLRAGTTRAGTLWCTVTDGAGRLRPIRVRWEPAHDGGGTMIFLLDVEGDTREERAELERLQRELVERERLAALGEAAAVMAHEVRNPIGAILNAVAVMRHVPPGGAEAIDMMRVIQEEALRLERLVRDLLDLGRPLLPRCLPVDLFELASASVSLLRDRRECDGVTFELGQAPGSAVAEVDPDLVQLAVLNIVRNAAQASPPGSEVRVAVGRIADSVRITVEDAGPGMEEDVVRRAFEPFFTTRPAGTGIGLAVVRRVVEVHAGEVHVSRCEGRGSRVELVFPSKSASTATGITGRRA
jgi:signal transduction histidine kinase